MGQVNVLERIRVHPDVMVGKPTIRRMRITVEQILKAMANGVPTDQLLDEYPELENFYMEQAGALKCGLLPVSHTLLKDGKDDGFRVISTYQPVFI